MSLSPAQRSCAAGWVVLAAGAALAAVIGPVVGLAWFVVVVVWMGVAEKRGGRS